MNCKMTTNSQLSTTEPKKQKQKQKQTKQMTRTGTDSQKWRSHGGLSVGRIREKIQGITSIIGKYKIDREIKNSVGNGEAKELTCMIHGHELREAMLVGAGGSGQREIKGRKKWDNCNSIINKIYLKN